MSIDNDEKMFAHEIPYNSVNPTIYDDVLDKFRKRIYYWYIKPAEDLRPLPYTGLITMGISCIVIDTLSGFRYGIEGDTTRADFIRFCRNHFPEFAGELPSDFLVDYPEIEQNTYAYILYKAFRCKILHESRIDYYAGVSGDVEFIGYDPDKNWILINPHSLLERTKDVLHICIDEAQEGEYKVNFQRRFHYAFQGEIDTSCWNLD